MTAVPDSPTDEEYRSLGAGVQATVGVYVAVISVGIASLAAAGAGSSIGTALSLVPTVFTAGLVVGALAAWARPGSLAPLGASRWRTTALCLPGIGLGIATGTLVAIDGVPDPRLLAPAGVGAAGSVVIGALLARIAHDRYVEAAIAGDPAARVPWHLSGPDYSMILAGSGFLLVGLASPALFGWDRGGRFSVVNVLTGVTFVAIGAINGAGSDSELPLPFPSGLVPEKYRRVEALARGYLRVFDEGLVVDPYMKPSYSRLVPWERITDVRLTENELVIDRRRRPPIRCARDPIDDPKAVYEAIEAARRRAS